LSSGLIPDLENGIGTFWIEITGLQNGPTDGLALISPDGTTVIQFLSYGGAITATVGAASGMTSTDIGVTEGSSTPVGYSLQLSGVGTDYEDFSWAAANTSTKGFENNGQTFTGLSPTIIKGFNVTGLDYTGLGPSLEASFTVSGENLTNDIVLTAPANFEISESSGGVFTSTITLLKGAGTTITTTNIYVRLKSGLNIGSYNQNVTCISTGAISKTISVSGFVTPSIGSIIITEIMKAPDAVSYTLGEYFEVYNSTSSDIDMNGWIISDDGTDSHTISSSVMVPAGGYSVFAINSDSGTNGGFTADYVYSGISLADADDAIILSFGGTEIDRVAYDDGVTFPDSAGASMELHLFYYDSVSNDFGSHWGAATTAFGAGDLGTPGTENDFGLSVVKNEIENFIMYPNPVSNGKLYMSSSIKLNKEVQIYALTGQQVYSKNLQNQEPMDIANLNKGIYLVKIKEEGKIATRKLVVD